MTLLGLPAADAEYVQAFLPNASVLNAFGGQPTTGGTRKIARRAVGGRSQRRDEAHLEGDGLLQNLNLCVP